MHSSSASGYPLLCCLILCFLLPPQLSSFFERVIKLTLHDHSWLEKASTTFTCLRKTTDFLIGRDGRTNHFVLGFQKGEAGQPPYLYHRRRWRPAKSRISSIDFEFNSRPLSSSSLMKWPRPLQCWDALVRNPV